MKNIMTVLKYKQTKLPSVVQSPFIYLFATFILHFWPVIGARVVDLEWQQLAKTLR